MSSCSSLELRLPCPDCMLYPRIPRGWTAQPFPWEDACGNAGKGDGRMVVWWITTNFAENYILQSKKFLTIEAFFQGIWCKKQNRKKTKTGMDWFLILAVLQKVFPTTLELEHINSLKWNLKDLNALLERQEKEIPKFLCVTDVHTRKHNY